MKLVIEWWKWSVGMIECNDGWIRWQWWIEQYDLWWRWMNWWNDEWHDGWYDYVLKDDDWCNWTMDGMLLMDGINEMDVNGCVSDWVVEWIDG